MPVEAADLLARHKEKSGFLKGRILSDTSIPVRRNVRLWMFKQIAIPAQSASFKAYCEGRFRLGFKTEHQFPRGVHSFIESGYRGTSRIGGLLFELIEFGDDRIFLAIEARGHWDAKRFGGPEGQQRFDQVHGAEVEKAYRHGQYLAIATLFETADQMKRFVDQFKAKFGTLEWLRQECQGLHLVETGNTYVTSRRVPEKWIDAYRNEVVPDDFVDQLDDDAFRLLFGDGKTFHQLTPESRRMARAQVFQEFQYTPFSDTDLEDWYKNVKDPVELQHQYVLRCKIKSEIIVELRLPRRAFIEEAARG